jgi:hypothetical protein
MVGHIIVVVSGIVLIEFVIYIIWLILKYKKYKNEYRTIEKRPKGK